MSAPASPKPEPSIWEHLTQTVSDLIETPVPQLIVGDIDENAGHFGAAGHSAQVAAQAREVAFLHKALGLPLK